MELVLVGDLKQWGYCARIVYFRYTMGGAGRATYKMEEGKAAQEMIEGLEVRRGLAEYGVEWGRRRFGVWLKDEKLGLTGKLDLLLKGDGKGAPVEFKLTSGELGENHRLQLAGYALLVEAALGLRVEKGFLYRIPDGRVFGVDITEELREKAVRAVGAIREMAEREWCPEPTAVRQRCVECEYANYCGDVW